MQQAPVNIWTTLTNAFGLLQGCARPIIQLCIFAVLLPALALSFGTGIASGPIAEEIKAITEQITQSGQGANYLDLLTPTYGFLWGSVIATAVLACLFIAVYLGVIHIFVTQHLQKPIPSAPRALIYGFRRLIPTLGITLAIALLSLEQFVFGPMRVFSIFALMAINIMVAEHLPARKALPRALFFRYANPAVTNGFALALILVGLGVFGFLYEQLLALIFNQIVHFDGPIPFGDALWTQAVLGAPFTWMFVFAQILTTTLLTFIIPLFAAFTTALFFLAGRTSTRVLSRL